MLLCLESNNLHRNRGRLREKDEQRTLKSFIDLFSLNLLPGIIVLGIYLQLNATILYRTFFYLNKNEFTFAYVIHPFSIKNAETSFIYVYAYVFIGVFEIYFSILLITMSNIGKNQRFFLPCNRHQLPK